MVLINRTNKGQPHTKISLESRGVGECVKCQKWSGTPGLRSQDRTGQGSAGQGSAGSGVVLALSPDGND